jgi:phosphatidylserine/phosphatidylglycerophosphate/cardiolipin synthase-like enzyme
MEPTEVDFAVSGKYWVGETGDSILNTIREVSAIAKEEVQLTVYSFGTEIVEFGNILSKILDKGVRIQMIVNRFSKQPPKSIAMILSLKSKHRHLTVLDFNSANILENLHAKIIVVDRQWALVGSSNISWHGHISNHELAIILKGDIVEQISSMLDRLARSPVTKLIEK